MTESKKNRLYKIIDLKFSNKWETEKRFINKEMNAYLKENEIPHYADESEAAYYWFMLVYALDTLKV